MGKVFDQEDLIPGVGNAAGPLPGCRTGKHNTEHSMIYGHQRIALAFFPTTWNPLLTHNCAITTNDDVTSEMRTHSNIPPRDRFSCTVIGDNITSFGVRAAVGVPAGARSLLNPTGRTRTIEVK
jgi:hypothetical protein